MSTIAERYARAVFELGIETGRLAQLVTQVSALAEGYASSEDLRAVLDNPLIDDARRTAVLSSLASRLGLGPLAVNTARLLMQRHRMWLLPELGGALRRLADEHAGILRATVISAVPLPESYVQKLTRELEQAARRKVVIERREDTSLIAGVVTRIGDHTIDGSLKGRLEELERQLLAS